MKKLYNMDYHIANHADKLKNIKAFLLDMDGTLYLGNTLLDGSRELINFLNQKKIKFLLFTNNSSQSSDIYVDKFKNFGIEINKNNILSSTLVTGMYLKKKRYKRVYCIGTPSFREEIKSFGLILSETNPECIVLSFDKTLTYNKLKKACIFIDHGVDYIATNPDLVCPTETGYIPDCGSMIELIFTATSRRPKIMGKPHPAMINTALDLLNLKHDKVAIIGDRLYTDIKMGKDSNLLTILTLSGETKIDNLAYSEILPDIIINSVKELYEFLNT